MGGVWQVKRCSTDILTNPSNFTARAIPTNRVPRQGSIMLSRLELLEWHVGAPLTRSKTKAANRGAEWAEFRKGGWLRGIMEDQLENSGR